MRVSLQPSFTGNQINSIKNKSYNPNISITSKNDLFVKNQNHISFVGNAEHTKKMKTNVVDALKTIGFVGSGFALTLGTATLVAKNHNPEDIFLSDGTYFMNTKDMSFSSSKVIADTDDGIFKIKGSGIDIKPNEIDYVDPAKGIYKNYDGSVDIDLLNNKYIDKSNGIFVDPENNLSAVLVNGELKSIVVPNLNFGSGYSTNRNDPNGGYGYDREKEYEFQHSDINRFQHKAYYGSNPEDGLVKHDGRILPNDNRTAFQKFQDFFTPNHEHYDVTKNYDIFGREIIALKDKYGNISHATLDENMKEIINKYNLDEESINELANFAEKIKLNSYMAEFNPEFIKYLPKTESIEDFISRLHKVENSNIDNDIETEVHSDDYMDGFMKFFDSFVPKEN